MNENTSATSNTTVEIPAILTAKTYFWSPATCANMRRRNEARRRDEVESFIAANHEKLEAAGVTIDFSYSESCHNVYKTCEIRRNGKRSNITAVRKALSC
jgi:hypothetical protein